MKNRLFTNLILILVLNCCYSCKSKKVVETIVNTEELSNAEVTREIKKALEDSIPSLLTFRIDSLKYEQWQELVKQVYQTNSYQPIWTCKAILNENGKDLYDFIEHAEYYALIKEKYNYTKLKQINDSLQSIQPNINISLIRDLELELSKSFFHIFLHINKGMYDEKNKIFNTNFWNLREKYIVYLTDSISQKKPSVLFKEAEPQNLIYKRYLNAIYNFVSKNNISENKITIRDYKTDSLGAIRDAATALCYHHYLEDSLTNNYQAYILALKKFQQDHGYKADGVVGNMTARALERDNSKKFKLLVINADRWRQNNIDNPQKYVWVNLPSYKLKIIVNDSVKLEKNVVIGKANTKNATPILESKINRIVLWPTWSVPQSIIKNEMKSFKGYKVTKKGNYLTVVQPPGPRNALGAVKILFPNKHSVYIHDTPSKSLFNSDYRSHSHGCVRCQDPLEVAAYLLQLDTFNISYDSLLNIKQKKITTKTFTLKNPIPVFLQYFTADVSWNGMLNFYPDIYKRDEDRIDALFGKDAPSIPKPIVKDSIIVAPKKTDTLIKTITTNPILQDTPSTPTVADTLIQ